MFNNSGSPLERLIFLAGVGQICLVLVSFVIPRILGWREEMARLRPLTRQVFTTYAFYIVGTNLAFGLLSALAPRWLLAPTGLAAAVAGFIAVYWGARVVIQFAYYDRRGGPSGTGARLAETALVALFLYLTFVYGYTAFLDAISVRP